MLGARSPLDVGPGASAQERRSPAAPGPGKAAAASARPASPGPDGPAAAGAAALGDRSDDLDEEEAGQDPAPMRPRPLIRVRTAPGPRGRAGRD